MAGDAGGQGKSSLAVAIHNSSARKYGRLEQGTNRRPESKQRSGEAASVPHTRRHLQRVALLTAGVHQRGLQELLRRRGGRVSACGCCRRRVAKLLPCSCRLLLLLLHAAGHAADVGT